MKFTLLLARFFAFAGLLTGLSGFEYPRITPEYYSQHGQDKFLNEVVFQGKKEGVFLEIGAHDGISFSNTYFFEKNFDWKGICVEPIKQQFEKLIKNRHCICDNLAISTHAGTKKFLQCSGYITEMYSGLLDYYDPRHVQRIDREIQEYGGGKEVIEIQCTTFNDLLKSHQIQYVDLLSLDIEGGEEEILRSIDFDQVIIDVILVENNFNENSIRSYLSNKGYLFLKRIGKDDVFQRTKKND